MNTGIDEGMFVAEPLQTPCYFLRRLFLSILRTKRGKNQLANPGDCLPSTLPTQPCES